MVSLASPLPPLAAPDDSLLNESSGGRRLLAADLGQIDGVMDGQDVLVIGPELAQVEAVAFLAVVNAG